MTTYQRSGPEFRLCGQFNGKDGQSAARWLKKFEWEMAGYADSYGVIPASKYLQAVDILLTEDAAFWAEMDPEVSAILTTASPSQNTVSQFKAKLIDKYPAPIADVVPISFDSEMAELKQGPNESLLAYYKRITALMSKVGARDRARSSSTPAPTPLSPLESAMLDTILRAFIRGLNDDGIKRSAVAHIVSSDRSLFGVYTAAEEARRAKIELQKLKQEEQKLKDLEFYRSLVQRNMPSQQIEALRAAFHTGQVQSTLSGSDLY